MLVVFYNSPDYRIQNFEKITFSEAVMVSQEVELSCREEKKQFTCEFQVMGEDGKLYYKGNFNFGSYDFQNIYHQIKEKVGRIKVNSENVEDVTYLLDEIELLTPDEYKEIEEVDKTLINLDKSKISRFTLKQRRIIYGLGALSLAGFLITGAFSFIQKDSYERAIDESKSQLAKSEKLSEIYESALLENSDEMVSYLESTDNLTDSQVKLLLNQYFSKNEFEKAVNLLDGDAVNTETMLLKSNFTEKEKVAKISAFNEIYPTNEAKYDLAYFNKDYKLMLNIQTVMMTVERSEMRTYALLKTGDLEGAKTELSNNNNEDLENKIIQYEVITAEIKTLQDKYDLVTKEGNGSEAKKIKEQIDSKKAELNAL